MNDATGLRRFTTLGLAYNFGLRSNECTNLGEVRMLIDIYMANTLGVPQHRDFSVLLNVLHQLIGPCDITDTK